MFWIGIDLNCLMRFLHPEKQKKKKKKERESTNQNKKNFKSECILFFAIAKKAVVGFTNKQPSSTAFFLDLYEI